MANFWGATSLIGGGTGALDAIDGALLAGGDGAMVITNGTVYLYYLNASSSDTEASPNIVVPDTNPGTKRWELLNPSAHDSKVMRGAGGTTKSWFYQDTAPPGWTVDATPADALLAVKGGSQAYNTSGGAQVGTWTQPNHTHSLSAHTHTGPSHTHGMNSHTHTGPSHSHTISHTHTTGDVTLTASESGVATHEHSIRTEGVGISTYDGSTYKYPREWTSSGQACNDTGGTLTYTRANSTASASSAHNHGSTGAASSSSSGSDGTGTTGAATGTTASDGTGATAGPSSDTSGNGATATTWRPLAQLGIICTLDA